MICPACGEAKSAASSAGGGEWQGYRYDYLRCRACRSLFVAPMPNAAMIEQMYGAEYAHAHYEKDLAGDLASERDRALDLASARAGRLLDVGAGDGSFLTLAAARGLDAHGYEPNTDAAAHAATRSRCPVSHGALTDIPGRFDVVHAADVLEHLPDPLTTLTMVSKTLAANGIIIARGPLEAQPNLFDLAMRARRRVRAFRRRAHATLPPWHVVLFSLAGWRALARRAGLVTIGERVDEITWPASGRTLPVKLASIRLTHSRLGRARSLGNRVLSVWTRRG